MSKGACPFYLTTTKNRVADMQKLEEWILPHLHKPGVFIPSSIVLVIFTTYFVADRFGVNWYSCALFPSLVETFLVIIYVLFTKYPTTKKDHIGLIFAVTGESAESARIIEADFVTPIRRELSRHAPRTPFHVFSLSQFHSNKIRDIATAKIALRKCKGHFLVYGDMRERRDNGKKYHVMRLEAGIAHRPISQAKSDIFAVEMQKSLPLHEKIEDESILSQFELTSAMFANGAKFVVARAAVFSGDFSLAETLYDEVSVSIKPTKKRGRRQQTNDLVKLLPDAQADCYFEFYQHFAREWQTNRQPENMLVAETYLDKLNSVSSNDYRYHLAKAQCVFVLRRDLKLAMQHTDKASKLISADIHWRYSKAFLFAYTGKLTEAWKEYQRLAERPNFPPLPLEIEEFIGWVISEEPDKFQLYYCLGILNLLVKDDRIAARADLERFVNHPRVSEFADCEKWARKKILELQPA